MRNFTKLVMASAMLATQATPTAPYVDAASVRASVPTVVSSESMIHFSTASVYAVELETKPQPDFDSEVLVPLRKAQADAAQKAAEAKAAQAAAQKVAQAATASTNSYHYDQKLCV